MNDKLNEMFERQKKLQEVIENIDGLPDDKPILAHNNFSHLVSEASEIFQLDDRWKNWKKNPKFDPINDKYEKLEEIADAFHCLINICLYSGYTVEEVYEAFIRKNDINFDRQEGDY